MSSLSIYAVVDHRQFIGAVALVNSLRLVGHDSPIVILDCGLEERQRECLAAEATIVPSPRATAPHLLKAVAPLSNPADLMLVADADIIVTQPLHELCERAAAGKIVAFADRLSDRFHPGWQEALRLRAPPRRQIYVNTGLLLLPRAPGLRLLRRLEECAPLADVDESLFGRGRPENPLYFLDQDILNALLATDFAPGDVDVLPHRLAPHPPFKDVRIVDEQTLTCAYPDGEHPVLLHHIQRKPWLDAVPANAYSRLLPRLLFAPDVAIRLARADVPLRVHGGALGRAVRLGGTLADSFNNRRRALGIRRRERFVAPHYPAGEEAQ